MWDENNVLGNERVCGSVDGLWSCAAHLTMAAKYGIGFESAFFIYDHYFC
jgi:hypothetical protein